MVITKTVCNCCLVLKLGQTCYEIETQLKRNSHGCVWKVQCDGVDEYRLAGTWGEMNQEWAFHVLLALMLDRASLMLRWSVRPGP
mgnify:CR=1 FL=1